MSSVTAPREVPARVRRYRLWSKMRPAQLLTPHRYAPPLVRWQTAQKLRRPHGKQRVQILATSRAQTRAAARAAACTLVHADTGLVPEVRSLMPVVPSWVSCPRMGACTIRTTCAKRVVHSIAPSAMG